MWPIDSSSDDPWRVQRWLIILLKISLLIGAGLSFLQGRLLAGTATVGIMLITFLPVLLGRRFEVKIPPEFELLAVVFIYASLFLGEIHGYYVRFWWWDIILHTGSGFLLGILGFLLVYVLNEKKDIDLDLRPHFVALFAFMFALGLGTIWEIFEFAADQIFDSNMQESGLVDTMWDLIVDSIGALVIAILGWGFLCKRDKHSFLEEWIADFIKRNPRLFTRRRRL